MKLIFRKMQMEDLFVCIKKKIVSFIGWDCQKVRVNVYERMGSRRSSDTKFDLTITGLYVSFNVVNEKTNVDLMIAVTRM